MMDGITDMEDANKRLLNSGNLSDEMYNKYKKKTKVWMKGYVYF